MSFSFFPVIAGIGIPFFEGSSPLVNFLSVMGIVAAISFAAEYITYTFGRAPMPNWRMGSTALLLAIVYIFWHVWSHQVDFVSQSINPEGGSFRLSLLGFLVVSAVLPIWFCINSSISTFRESWMPGITLFVIRFVTCIGLWMGLIYTGTTLFQLMDGVKLF